MIDNNENEVSLKEDTTGKAPQTSDLVVQTGKDAVKAEPDMKDNITVIHPVEDSSRKKLKNNKDKKTSKANSNKPSQSKPKKPAAKESYQPKTHFTRNEYEKQTRKFIRDNSRLFCESMLSPLSLYVRDYRFRNLDYAEIKQKAEMKPLEEILFKYMEGFHNLSDLKHNAIILAYRKANGVRPETAIKEYIKEVCPEAKDFQYFYRGQYGKCVEKEVHLLMRSIEGRARSIFFQTIQENADFMRIDRMIFDERKQLESMLLDTIPEKMPDLYPLARRMKRHFILHVGPTNSGKTYQALQALKEAEKGIYLAPLRLLAYEIYDRLNGEGVPCNMITGEEEIIRPEALHYAATIETLSITDYFDVAVIDEGQMIADSKRGGAWTRALLGVCAPRVHICSDSSCVNLICKIIEECGDTYELMYNKRMVPLKMDERKFEFPGSIQEKDALIVFSKRSVIAVTAELQKAGISASMIYGNLPYDVRMNEVRRFVEGETKVVVATDAIGMGLNLPIRRIIFLETRKFDGERIRPLTGSEIKQIAGRAGRRGLFETGFYTSEFRRGSIRKAVEEPLQELTSARLGIPESIIQLNMPLSDILSRWSELPSDALYEKADFSEDISLCRMLESHVANKQILYDLITLGVRSSKKIMADLLLKMAMIEESAEQEKEKFINRILDDTLIPDAVLLEGMQMEELEDLYLVYDLLYAYLRKFHHPARMGEVIYRKRECSARIIEILKNQKLETRKCKLCGSELSWNYPYSTCLDCYVGANT